MRGRGPFNLRQNLVSWVVTALFTVLVGVQPLHGASGSNGAGYKLVKGTNEFGLWAGG